MQWMVEWEFHPDGKALRVDQRLNENTKISQACAELLFLGDDDDMWMSDFHMCVVYTYMYAAARDYMGVRMRLSICVCVCMFMCV